MDRYKKISTATYLAGTTQFYGLQTDGKIVTVRAVNDKFDENDKLAERENLSRQKYKETVESLTDVIDIAAHSFGICILKKDGGVTADENFNDRDNLENEITSSDITELSPTESEYDEYIISNSNSAYLNQEDIKNLSAEELRIARNEIYARHGRIFQSQDLQEYFESKDWYHGTTEPSDFEESLLNDFEKKNEERKKCVLQIES